jgi:repressor LexA
MFYIGTREAVGAMGMRQQQRQKDVFDFVRSFLEENGFPPTYEEIRLAVGLSSRSHVHYYLCDLEQSGLIKRSARSPRSLRPVRLDPASFRADEETKPGTR